MSRPPLEVADVVRQHGAAFLAHYGPTLSGEQHRALRAIAVCRPPALGGHITQCDHCGHEVQAYKSCRHRCCPKCHGTAQAAWLAARERAVLETPYVHVIFTLPHDLSALALQNPRHLYGLLFRTVAQTLQDIAGNPKHLGAEIGGFAVLHTWGQQLHHHPHLHCVLPAGGLAAHGARWVPCRPHFFLPVRVLSRRFRHLYVAGLAQTYAQGQLTFTGRCRALTEPTPWQRLLATLRDQEWVVYAKEPIQDPQHVLQYLARLRPGVGRLRQRAHPGPPACAPVPGPLCPPHRHRQSPSRGPRAWPGDLPLQGLPAGPPPAHPDAGRHGVPAASAAARPPAWVPQATALRLPGQSGAPGEARAMPRSAGAGDATPSPGNGRGPQDV